ncbi:unnamed protein product [Pleuronectes platessa]|uniref:Uncharacterized protein n=1 Tax=Pleuronectes platessa TaxID=8262 RepID=A0A9N7UZQ9_PLEPL|nr:unnamed protein product [Pleuronectes platessa]
MVATKAHWKMSSGGVREAIWGLIDGSRRTAAAMFSDLPVCEPCLALSGKREKARFPLERDSLEPGRGVLYGGKQRKGGGGEARLWSWMIQGLALRDSSGLSGPNPHGNVQLSACRGSLCTPRWAMCSAHKAPRVNIRAESSTINTQVVESPPSADERTPAGCPVCACVLWQTYKPGSSTPWLSKQGFSTGAHIKKSSVWGLQETAGPLLCLVLEVLRDMSSL